MNSTISLANLIGCVLKLGSDISQRTQRAFEVISGTSTIMFNRRHLEELSICSHDLDLALFWQKILGSDTKQGGFPATIGTNQTGTLTLPYLQINVFKQRFRGV